MPVKDKWGGSRNRQGKPSSCDADLTPVNRNEGRGWGLKENRVREIQSVIQTWWSLSQPSRKQRYSLEESCKGRNDQALVPLPCSIISWRWSRQRAGLKLQWDPESAVEDWLRLTTFLAAGQLLFLKGCCSALPWVSQLPFSLIWVLVRIGYTVTLVKYLIISEPVVFSTYPLSQWVAQMKHDALSRNESSSWNFKSN